MSIRLVDADVVLEEGVMLRSDYITYTDKLDCLVYFIFHPFTVAHVRYDLAVSSPVRYDLAGLVSCL